MSAALVGGMDRLKREYVEAARKKGVSLKVFTGTERTLRDRLGDLDLIIVLTNKVSHSARNEVLSFAKANGTPIRMVHACGVSSFRKCLAA